METNEPQPNSQEKEPNLITPGEIDDLYEQADRYFFAKRDRVQVTPAVAAGVLTEAVETPLFDGQLLRFSRERPAYIDDPTAVADEAPLAMVDAEGKSVYHTPFLIEAVDVESGRVVQRISVARSGPSNTGAHLDGWAFDEIRESGKLVDVTEAEFNQIMGQIKA